VAAAIVLVTEASEYLMIKQLTVLMKLTVERRLNWLTWKIEIGMIDNKRSTN